MTHGQDTRAVFVGGPVDGRIQMMQGRPQFWQMDQFPSLAGSITADLEWPKITRHTYRRNDALFMDGDLTAYEYAGEN